jgi:1-pyrroline-5-carboxylate dehydrogenase
MSDGRYRVPDPVNEPIKGYAPGSPERASLEQRLRELSSERIGRDPSRRPAGRGEHADHRQCDDHDPSDGDVHVRTDASQSGNR